MKNLAKIILMAGMSFLASNLSAVPREKSGYYKMYESAGVHSVLTDGNNDGILDRVDEYKDGKKYETLFRDDEGEIVEFEWDSQECSYFFKTQEHDKKINEKWNYYEKIIWPDKC